MVKTKRGGFTKEKKERFFAALAATCNIAASCRRARISTHTVYAHRKKSAEFRARLAEVKRDAFERLELATLERMINGTVKTITQADGSVQTIHEYPIATALALLRMHRESVAETEAADELGAEEIEELRARLADKLERLRRRLDVEEPARGNGGGEPM